MRSSAAATSIDLVSSLHRIPHFIGSLLQMVVFDRDRLTVTETLTLIFSHDNHHKQFPV
jgi:hypothetical protein